MTKAEARRKLRELPSLPSEDRATRSVAICQRLRSYPKWEGARVVALYAATPHEPALETLWETDSARTFVFPRVEEDGKGGDRLSFYRVTTPAELVESRWGLREPVADATRLVLPQAIDFVAVPGVAFTADGIRLGRGRGHYDRFLPSLRPDAVVLGVCFAERLLPQLPAEPHDCRMHAVISA